MRPLLRLAAVAMTLSALAPPFARADQPLVVFAAASLKTALDAAAAGFRADGGPEVRISYGGSLGLARQIVAGAPADLFASADEPSMDEAVKGGAIRADTRADLLGNQLVVIAPAASPVKTLALTPAAFAEAIGTGKLATGEVATVPAGRYAKEALGNLGLWSAVEPHLAMTDNVRAALAFVARGEAALGIVYATDAAADPTVRIVATFPEASHAPILYPFALTASSHDGAAAAKFLAYLNSAAGRAIFERQGFRVLAEPTGAIR
jgi:molybdate transport system substrate-binding protein